ncbi:hypothetical protein D7223_12075 [Micromonospora endolithica]|uniref:Uncharacterized protein n=1 Tax=Micromonospora endolithica TaxID=230091 RepID=A0A3A9ZJK0_9ACTN|nr:hypothetical protein D7223_12075 [Micromonospora endolithica]
MLAALASGAGGELGRQAWTALTALVHRPSSDIDDDGSPLVPSGERELAALEATSADPVVAERLAEVLTRRGNNDPRFASDLDAVLTQAAAALNPPQVSNTITGRVSGSAIQGRDFSGPVTFG